MSSKIPMLYSNANMPIVYMDANGKKVLSIETIVKNPIVYSCITMIAKSVSSIPVFVELPADADKDLKADAASLIRTPNARHSFSVLLYRIVEDILIYGCSYLLRDVDNVDERINGLYHIHNNNLRENCNKDGALMSYSYLSSKGWTEVKVGQYGAKNNIIAIDNLTKASRSALSTNANQASPCSIVKDDVGLCNLIDQYNMVSIEKCSKFNGIIEIHNANDDMVEKVRSYIQNHPPGMPLCFKNTNVSWKNIDSNNDIYGVSSHLHIMKNIARVFGVPPILLGLQESNGQYQYESARRHFWEDTILPLTMHILNSIENWIDDFYPQIRLIPKWSSVPAFSDAWFEYAEKINKLDFLTRAEKRSLCNELFTGNIKYLNNE